MPAKTKPTKLNPSPEMDAAVRNMFAQPPERVRQIMAKKAVKKKEK